jgi:hypothetical protein
MEQSGGEQMAAFMHCCRNQQGENICKMSFQYKQDRNHEGSTVDVDFYFGVHNGLDG